MQYYDVKYPIKDNIEYLCSHNQVGTVDMADSLFATLSAKTFALLAGSLFAATIAALGIIGVFRLAAQRGSSLVTLETTMDGESDLYPDPQIFHKLFWPSIGMNILAFSFLVLVENIGTRLLAYLVFAITDGLTIGIILLYMNERLGIRVLLLTALATLMTGFIGYLSDFNFSWLGTYLFFALLVLFVIILVRFSVKISGWKRQIIASFGILVFIGYLLYDFSALKAARGARAINNWATAIDFSANIYLDVINLFLQILDAFSED